MVNNIFEQRLQMNKLLHDTKNKQNPKNTVSTVCTSKMSYIVVVQHISGQFFERANLLSKYHKMDEVGYSN